MNTNHHSVAFVKLVPDYRQASSLTEEPEFIFCIRRDLSGLDVNGRPCEACGRHMHSHKWAVLATYGQVITCSFKVDL